jgi:hypothetical protein
MIERIKDVELARQVEEQQELNPELKIHPGEETIAQSYAGFLLNRDPSKLFICDRCCGDQPKLIECDPVPTLEVLKMCFCQDCADEIENGAAPLLPVYFEQCQRLLDRFAPGVRLEKLASWRLQDWVTWLATGSNIPEPEITFFAQYCYEAVKGLCEEKPLMQKWLKETK